MYTLAKELRDKPLDELRTILRDKLEAMDEKWAAFDRFRLHGQNKAFVKYLLSRLSGYVDEMAGESTNFVNYFHKSAGKPFEIEHIWSQHFVEHSDEFEQQHEFEEYRNRIGALVLLPRGTNQSYGDKPYGTKKTHYIKENLLVKSLCPLTYENNPNFQRLMKDHGMGFRAHDDFNKADVETRQALYQSICEQI
jgi:hypothetical protein